MRFKEEQNKLKKKYIVFFMLYITVFTFYFTSDTLSKYVTEVDLTTTLPNVATWDVSASAISNGNISLISNDSINNKKVYNISVTSNSEVAATYKIILSNVQTNITVSLDGGEYISPVNNTITLTNSNCMFDANDSNSTHNHKLRFMAPEGIDSIDDNTISVDIVIVQKEI